MLWEIRLRISSKNIQTTTILVKNKKTIKLGRFLTHRIPNKEPQNLKETLEILLIKLFLLRSVKLNQKRIPIWLIIRNDCYKFLLQSIEFKVIIL